MLNFIMFNILRFVRSYEKTHQDLLIISIAYMIFSIGGTLFWVSIPILSKSYALSAFYIGLIMASIGVVYILSDSILGALSDFLGYKRSLILACFFALITAAISMFGPPLWGFLIGVVFFALSWNFLTISSDAYLLYTTPRKEESTYWGVNESFYSLGVFMATPFIGYVAKWSFFGSGLFFLIFILFATFLFLFLKTEEREYPKKLSEAFDGFLHRGLKIKRAISSVKELGPVAQATMINSFFGHFFSSITWFLIPFSLGLFENPYIPSGLALGVFELPAILFGVVGGVLADKFSKKAVFNIFMISSGILTVLLAPALTNFVLFMIVGFLVSSTDTLAGPALWGMIVMVDKKHDKDGTAMGNIAVFSDFAFVLGPIAGGAIYTIFDLPTVFIFAGIVVLLGWLACFYLLRKEKRVS